MKHLWLYNLGRGYAAYLRAANAPHNFKPGGRWLGPKLITLQNRISGAFK